MQTIPDRILSHMIADQPHLAAMVANLRANPGQAIRFEKSLAFAYMSGPCTMAPLDVWHLAQVAHGGPWGGDWVTTEYAAGLSGYDAAHLRRLAGSGVLPAIKRGKTWYVRRDALPNKQAAA